MVSINVAQAARLEAAARRASKAAALRHLTEQDAGCPAVPSDVDGHQPVFSLGACAIGQDRIQGLSYVPDFVRREDETALIAAIDHAAEGRWIDSSSGRRIANFGGRPGTLNVVEALPAPLAALAGRMEACRLLRGDQLPNHCLVNSYAGGAPCPVHQDGPLYSNHVVTVTLGGPALIDFFRCNADGSAGDKVVEVMLRPGAALLAAGEAYSGHLHGIPASHADIVGPLCCNCKAAGVSVGRTVLRAPRRLSLVFVQKLCQRAAAPRGGAHCVPAASPQQTVAGATGSAPSDSAAGVIQLRNCHSSNNLV